MYGGRPFRKDLAFVVHKNLSGTSFITNIKHAIAKKNFAGSGTPVRANAANQRATGDLNKIHTSTIHTRTALTPTSGFLKGYTHSFSPAIGCALGGTPCGAYCYAAFLQAHKIRGTGAWGEYLQVKENAADALESDLLRAARRDPGHRYSIGNLRIFASGSTEPLAGPLFAIYQKCLETAARFPMARWVVQTRLPRVTDLEPILLQLGRRVIVSITIETDIEDTTATDATPRGGACGPSIAARMRAAEQLHRAGVAVNVAVSPMLPLRAPKEFAAWIAQNATFATIDTAVTGDGTGTGARTARSPFALRASAAGYNWRDEAPARAFHRLLQKSMGERAGFSAQGFSQLATADW